MNTKKILSLLLCLALLAGLFAVSAAAEDKSASSAEKTMSGEDFTAAVGPQAFAVTMAAWLSGGEDSAVLADPLFLWDAAGWYAAWLYRTEGCDLLSPEDIGDFLRSLGAEADCPAPESWEEYGVLRVLHGLDGSENYDFVQHKVEIDAMLGVDTMVSFIGGDGSRLTVVLSCFYEDDLSAEWMYDLAFERTADELFPYRLTELHLLDKGPQMDEALNFSWDELLEANRLEKVLALYPAVRLAVTDELGEIDELSGTWLFAQDGEICLGQTKDRIDRPRENDILVKRVVVLLPYRHQLARDELTVADGLPKLAVDGNVRQGLIIYNAHRLDGQNFARIA